MMMRDYVIEALAERLAKVRARDQRQRDGR